MKILFTGASSFTGLWFVEALAAAGCEVVAPLRGRLDAYEPARARRMQRVARCARVVESAAFGNDRFQELLREAGPFDVLCHHAADVANYRSPDFDVPAALANNTLGLRTVLTELRRRNAAAVVVLTGSVFEADEGQGESPLRAFSPYGLSKGLTWQVFRHFCGVAGVRLGKFVIPNPFGPYEEPRFTAYLCRQWREGKSASVQTPAYVRDNIHVGLLALAYARLVQRRVAEADPVVRANPSGYTETQGEFAQRFARELRARSGWDCRVDLLEQRDFPEPLRRVNLEPAAPLHPEWNETAAWDAAAEFYR